MARQTGRPSRTSRAGSRPVGGTDENATGRDRDAASFERQADPQAGAGTPAAGPGVGLATCRAPAWPRWSAPSS